MLHSYCERSELCLHFESTKVNQKSQKWLILAIFWKLESCGQTVLPDRSLLIEQKWWKMPKFKTSNAKFWVIFKHWEKFAKISEKIIVRSSTTKSFHCSDKRTNVSYERREHTYAAATQSRDLCILLYRSHSYGWKVEYNIRAIKHHQQFSHKWLLT